MEGTRMIENIHEGVETTPTHEYEEVVLVTGKYWFCHFGQQDFDDSVRSSKRRDIWKWSKINPSGVGLRISLDADAM